MCAFAFLYWYWLDVSHASQHTCFKTDLKWPFHIMTRLLCKIYKGSRNGTKNSKLCKIQKATANKASTFHCCCWQISKWSHLVLCPAALTWSASNSWRVVIFSKNHEVFSLPWHSKSASLETYKCLITLHYCNVNINV